VGENSCIASGFFVLVLSEAVLSETVLVLDGCLDLCNTDGWSKRFTVICRLLGWIAILDRFEYEYEYHFIEYEYEKTSRIHS